MTINRDVIRQKLMARKDELERDLQRFVENRASIEAESVQDPLDQAIKSSLEDLSITLEENGREELERLKEALAMLDAGTYGACADCKAPISERRLELYPNATRCIACQEKREAAA